MFERKKGSAGNAPNVTFVVDGSLRTVRARRNGRKTWDETVLGFLKVCQ